MYYGIITGIHNKLILEHEKKIHNDETIELNVIQKYFMDMINDEYYSQLTAKKNIIDKLLDINCDNNCDDNIYYAISGALMSNLFKNKTYLSEYIYYNTLIKTCIEYDDLNDDNIKNKLNIIVNEINKKLNNSNFIIKFNEENKDILKYNRIKSTNSIWYITFMLSIISSSIVIYYSK
jgi:hypothetical protein